VFEITIQFIETYILSEFIYYIDKFYCVSILCYSYFILNPTNIEIQYFNYMFTYESNKFSIALRRILYYIHAINSKISSRN